MSQSHRVRVWPLPQWLDWQRLLGPGQWSISEQPSGALEAQGQLTRDEAADLAARLRAVGIGGERLTTEVIPGLHRSDVRKARLIEARRYRKGSPGFSKAGAQLDPLAKRSLTPEALALQIGQRAKGLKVIDACCGAGGNAIGFARAGCKVIAIELNEDRVAMAKHNARLYDVAERIEFIHGDACDIVPHKRADLLFVDPPWVEQEETVGTALGDLPPLEKLVESTAHIPRLWAKVPASFAATTLPGCRAEAFFGVGEGDQRRVKFLLLELDRATTS